MASERSIPFERACILSLSLLLLLLLLRIDASIVKGIVYYMRRALSPFLSLSPITFRS